MTSNRSRKRASYIGTAAHKRHRQHSVTGMVQVYVRTNPFKADAPQYQRGLNVPLPEPTDDTLRLVRVAHWAPKTIYRPGYAYQKAGVCLMNLSDSATAQKSLFCSGKDNTWLMQTLDRINATFGRGTLYSAAEGVRKEWTMKREMKSSVYTTRWDQLPQAH